MRPFHLAIPSNDLEKMKQFYIGLLGANIGRETDQWVDFNFFGHQLSVHLKPEEITPIASNTVDDKAVPVRHFGIILEWDQWHELAQKLQDHQINFIIEPTIRFAGKTGEQATLFFTDPSNNALEFKAFKDESQLFTS